MAGLSPRTEAGASAAAVAWRGAGAGPGVAACGTTVAVARARAGGVPSAQPRAGKVQIVSCVSPTHLRFRISYHSPTAAILPGAELAAGLEQDPDPEVHDPLAVALAPASGIALLDQVHGGIEIPPAPD